MFDVQRRFILCENWKETTLKGVRSIEGKEIIRGNLAEFLWRGLNWMRSIFKAVFLSHNAKNFPCSLITAFLHATHFSQLQENFWALFCGWWNREVELSCVEFTRDFSSTLLLLVHIQWPRFLVKAPSWSTDCFLFLRFSLSQREVSRRAIWLFHSELFGWLFWIAPTKFHQ